MKNDQSPPLDDLQRTNLVYEFKCKQGDCEHLNISYIGVTRTTLSRRLTMHKSSGAPKDHYNNKHNAGLSREALVNSTKIIRQENDPVRLMIFEALLIHIKRPSINQQSTGASRTLKLHNIGRSTVRTQSEHPDSGSSLDNNRTSVEGGSTES